MKAAIDLISRKLASSEYSHQSSWAHLRANQLRNLGIEVDVLDYDGPRHSRDWSAYDTIFVYHGMDYRDDGNLNIFDGLVEYSARNFSRLNYPQHSHIKYISIDHPMPDYGALCKARGGEPGSYWANVDWDGVSKRCENVDWFKEPALHYAPGKVRHLVIGDSHSHSAYVANSMMLRKDGRTLNGVLKKTISKEITDYGYDLTEIDSLTCYWGNIDIRHHLCRETDPTAATRDLLKRYEAELKTLNKKIELVTPLPIEDESRVIPKSGYFKGTPFFGTREERQDLVKIFKEELHEMAARNGWTVFAWPEYWYEMDGVEFMKTRLEKPRSVHLARKFYRWDLVNNVLNDYHKIDYQHEAVSPIVNSLLEF